MRKALSISSMLLIITSCSSFTSTDILVGELSVSDKSVSDEILCLTAFTSEVKIPKSKIQKNILDELKNRNITPEQCSSYVVSKARGIDSFCRDFNRGYVTGAATRMPSFGNYITLQDMFLVQKTLNINCNTKQYLMEYNRTHENSYKYQNSISEPVDFSKGWKMFQQKTNVVNCMSMNSSTICNDTNGNLLNINRF